MDRAKIYNFLAFQIGWFACVLGAANCNGWIGPLIVAALLLVHFATCRSRGIELRNLVTATAIGTLVDLGHTALGTLQFDPSFHLEGWSIGGLPLWMIALWAMFATTIRSSLAWLRARLVLAFMLGAVAGPLAYAGGERMGALTLQGRPWVVAATIGLGWGFLTPLLLVLAPAKKATDAR